MANDFTPEHVRSTKKTEFYPSLILNDSLFELKIIDLPTIPFFPSNTDVEWNEYRFYGLRSASAYLLVYDASVPSTFQVRTSKIKIEERETFSPFFRTYGFLYCVLI